MAEAAIPNTNLIAANNIKELDAPATSDVRLKPITLIASMILLFQFLD